MKRTRYAQTREITILLVSVEDLKLKETKENQQSWRRWLVSSVSIIHPCGLIYLFLLFRIHFSCRVLVEYLAASWRIQGRLSISRMLRWIASASCRHCPCCLSISIQHSRKRGKEIFKTNRELVRKKLKEMRWMIVLHSSRSWRTQ